MYFLITYIDSDCAVVATIAMKSHCSWKLIPAWLNTRESSYTVAAVGTTLNTHSFRAELVFDEKQTLHQV